jgi:uncharacterized protein YjiS (DUF1127 family)
MARIFTSAWAATGQGRALWSAIFAFRSLLVLWRWRVRYRHELSSLTPPQLRDVGLDPEVVARESNKPVWEA